MVPTTDEIVRMRMYCTILLRGIGLSMTGFVLLLCFILVLLAAGGGGSVYRLLSGSSSHPSSYANAGVFSTLALAVLFACAGSGLVLVGLSGRLSRVLIPLRTKLLCPRCSYTLEGIEGSNCPECAVPLSEAMCRQDTPGADPDLPTLVIIADTDTRAVRGIGLVLVGSGVAGVVIIAGLVLPDIFTGRGVRNAPVLLATLTLLALSAGLCMLTVNAWLDALIRVSGAPLPAGEETALTNSSGVSES